jgi:hypothetical protein
MTTDQLRRLRWGVRAVLALGVFASVAANILHASDNPISRVISAWPPVALLFTVELIAKVPATNPWRAFARIAAASCLAVIAAWASYWHMVGVAVRYHEDAYAAHYLLPLTVDGLIVVASICLVELGRRLAASVPLATTTLEERPPTPTLPPQPEPPTFPTPDPGGEPEIVQPDKPAELPTPPAQKPRPAPKASPDLGVDERALARSTYRRSIREGSPMSQRALAAAMGKSQPWAADRIREVQSETAQVNGRAPEGVAVP